MNDNTVKRQFTGVFIPAKLYLDNNLKWIEKILIAEIESLTSETTPCKASNEHFSKHLGVSKDRVSKIISNLVNKGYIISQINYKKNTKEVHERLLLVNRTYSYFYRYPIGENNYTLSLKTTSINNNILNNNNTPYNPPKGGGEDLEEKFKKFWEEYPKKVSKGNAEKWFKKHKPTNELVDLMIEKIKQLKETEQWKKDKGQFIPYPATWLNAKGWEDEILETKPKYDTETIFYNEYIGKYKLDENGRRIFV